MFYLYAKEVSQSIYWRHQIGQLVPQACQCLSNLEHIEQLLSQNTVTGIVGIVMDQSDLDHFRTYKNVINHAKVQVLLIYPREGQAGTDLGYLTEILQLLEHDEATESLGSLTQKLVRPITNIKMATSQQYGARLDLNTSPCDQTVPLEEMALKDESLCNQGKRQSTLGWFTSQMVKGRSSKLKSQLTQFKGRLAVMGEDFGAYELAGCMAAGGSRTAVIDLDRFSPSMDIRMGVNTQINYQYLEMDKGSQTGLYVLMDCAKLGPLDWETIEKCSQKVKGFEKLYCFTGLYKLSDFEYFTTGDLERVLEGIHRHFDAIVLRINSFPYDAFTMKAIHWSDFIVNVSYWDINALRAYKQLITVLKEKQQIREDKHGLVLVESGEGDNLVLEQWVTGMCLLGKIPWHSMRTQNTKYAKTYFGKVSTELLPHYEKIIARLEVASGTR